MDDLEVVHERGQFARERDVDDAPRDPRHAVPKRTQSQRQLATMTVAITVALGIGLLAGATARGPREVPGPTVTQTVTRSAMPTAVDTRFGMSTREQYATMIFIEPGVQTVGKGAPPGTWVGVPLSSDQLCHWQRIRTDAAGRSIIAAEVLTNSQTMVTIRPDDNRFVSYGCRWVRQD